MGIDYNLGVPSLSHRLGRLLSLEMLWLYLEPPNILKALDLPQIHTLAG